MDEKKRILLGHGGGGLLTRNLIDEEILKRFGDGPLRGLPDGALLPSIDGDIVFSTDSFVVSPGFFPGGNIGDLAVHGTVNDIAVSGATPLWLSLALIIEEGLPLASLQTVLDSVRTAADNCGVQVVTGDTKVVRKGQCDGLYVNTAGIGKKIAGFNLGSSQVQTGDRVLVSGNLGDHGMAVMAAREGLGNGALKSDSAPVHRLVHALSPFAADVRFMRDPTRGGMAATLNEIVDGADVGILLREDSLPFSAGAKGLAEMLGFDLLHVASEGRMMCICSAEAAEQVIEKWRSLPEGTDACEIGRITEDSGRVILETGIGGKRIVDVPQGELLPRIC
ncbi:MAG: hydrogenase expression/formation protein HypE [Deltaproteobacteria bacterium]|nr:hydrogenase expression/formation protein HypE [Deltaproteobacteria bacterium]MBN2670486.1 hydrogenase expression/formation protein HypE [Deltaproteobacteria bacterium]